MNPITIIPKLFSRKNEREREIACVADNPDLDNMVTNTASLVPSPDIEIGIRLTTFPIANVPINKKGLIWNPVILDIYII
jgi:hypothetical protein